MALARLSFRMKGNEKVEARLIKQAKEAPDALLEASVEEMQVERDEMFKRTPVRYGDLRESLAVVHNQTAKRIQVWVMTDVEYAPYVHEDLEAFHAVGDAKFIESVLDESAPHILKRIGARLRVKLAAI